MRRPSPLMTILAVHVLAWIGTLASIPLAEQDFPLNDDWAFSLGAFAFYRSGEVQYFHWASLPLFGQWLWSYPFLALFGESCVSLRLSTIVISCLGLVATYHLFRELGVRSENHAALGSALVWWTPITFVNTGTYMTDVPSMAFTMLTLASFTRGLRTQSVWLLLLGGGFALLGAFNRQNLVFAPIAVLIVAWKSAMPLGMRGVLLLSTLAPLLAGIGVNQWLAGREDVLPYGTRFQIERLVFFPLILVITCALSTFPAFWGRRAKGAILWAMALLTLALARIQLRDAVNGFELMFGGLPPFVGNTVSPWGGFGQGILLGDRPLLLEEWFRWVLLITGCLCAGRWLAYCFELRVVTWWNPLTLFTLGQILLLAVSRSLFDRYFILLLPGFLLPVLLLWEWGTRTASRTSAPERYSAIPLWLGIGLLLGLSVCLTHDTLAWNAARWKLGRRLVREGVPLEDIQGGFEWVAWHANRHGWPRRDDPTQYDLDIVLPLTEHWESLRATQAMAFSVPEKQAEELEVIDSEPYMNWLPPEERRIYLVRRVRK